MENTSYKKYYGNNGFGILVGKWFYPFQKYQKCWRGQEFLTANFFETGAMATPTKSQNQLVLGPSYTL